MNRDCPDAKLAELEAQARDAHQAYLDALEAWERALEQQDADIDGPAGEAARSAAVSEVAQAEKERRRIAFRDLCDRLGYLPIRSNRRQ